MHELPLGRGAYVRARLALLTIVGDHHDVRVVFKTLPTGMVAYLAGFRLRRRRGRVAVPLAPPAGGGADGRHLARHRCRDAAVPAFVPHGVRQSDRGRARATEREAGGRPIRTRTVESTALALRERTQQVDDFITRPFGRIRSAAPATPHRPRAGRPVSAAAERADVGTCPPPRTACPRTMTGDRLTEAMTVRGDDRAGDVGRTAVYACELAAFDGTDLEDVRPYDEIAADRPSRSSRCLVAGPVVSRRGRLGAGAASSRRTGRSAAAGRTGRDPTRRGAGDGRDGGARTRPRPRRCGARPRRGVPAGLPRRDRGDHEPRSDRSPRRRSMSTNWPMRSPQPA